MAVTKMTKAEILGTIGKAAEKAWDRKRYCDERYGVSHEITQFAVAEWKALDILCCDLDIMY